MRSKVLLGLFFAAFVAVTACVSYSDNSVAAAPQSAVADPTPTGKVKTPATQREIAFIDKWDGQKLVKTDTEWKNITFSANREQSGPIPAHSTTIKRKAHIIVPRAGWHCSSRLQNMIPKPAGPAFTNRSAIRTSPKRSIEPSRRKSAPRYTVPAAAAISAMFLTTAPTQPDFAIA